MRMTANIVSACARAVFYLFIFCSAVRTCVLFLGRYARARRELFELCGLIARE